MNPYVFFKSTVIVVLCTSCNNNAVKGSLPNIIIIFTDDNGPWMVYGNHGGSAGGLREAKGSVFEGGFRVPCIMKWPKMIPKGVICSNIAGTIDLLPTIAEIT